MFSQTSLKMVDWRRMAGGGETLISWGAGGVGRFVYEVEAEGVSGSLSAMITLLGFVDMCCLYFV